MKTETMEQLTFDAQGLIPAVVQDFQSGEVLMLAYMNRESLSLTLEKGETYFWSRSRQELWHKGETSGNVQKVRAIRYDCDSDALLVKVDQSGSACHTGEYACFLAGREGWPDDVDSLGEVLGRLSRVIHRRNIERPAGSYTVKLLEGGVDRILRKVGEEATEVVIAGKNQNGEEIAWEVADLLYHLMVLLELRGVSLHHVARELARRMGERDSKDDAAAR